MHLRVHCQVGEVMSIYEATSSTTQWIHYCGRKLRQTVKRYCTCPLLHPAAGAKFSTRAHVWGAKTQLAVNLRPRANSSNCFHTPLFTRFSFSNLNPSWGGTFRRATASSRIFSQFCSKFLVKNIKQQILLFLMKNTGIIQWYSEIEIWHSMIVYAQYEYYNSLPCIWLEFIRNSPITKQLYRESCNGSI